MWATDERDEDGWDWRPVRMEPGFRGRSGNPLDLLPPRTRAVVEALRGMGSLTAVAHAFGIRKQTVADHRRRALKILEPLAQAVKGGVVLYRVCYLCGRAPKLKDQSLCRECRRIYQREYRRRRQRAARDAEVLARIARTDPERLVRLVAEQRGEAAP
jgi:predicted nucleic acid-binding Zn ribbon protein